MPYVAIKPERYLNKIVEDGQCVAFVRAATGAPPSSLWKEGARIRDAVSIAHGTAIATFENGHYMNHATGNHAAIYLSHDESGVRVLDQWSGQPVHERTIHWHGTRGPSNDADAFSIIE